MARSTRKPAAPAPAPAPVQGPAPAPVAAPAPVVALRGGLAVAAVQATGKAYRTAAAHNRDWWTTIGAQCAAGGGTATVAALLEAKVPSHFVGYAIRRGYLKAVAAAPAAPAA